MKVTLPARKNHFTPRLLVADAYTIGSNKFESDKAKEKSVYYITFRRKPADFNPILFDTDDHRYIFYGLQKILENLFYEPITHKEIDDAMEFLADKKVTTTGLTRYDCPEEIWRKVVDEYNGRPPILIKALPEGSVFYPQEPIVQIESQVDGMGVLAAWFESKILQLWDDCEFVTQNEHWLKYCKSVVRKVYRTTFEDEVEFMAGLMIHNFGDRAGMNWLESELLGEAYLLTFSGTDTFSGAYQAWINSGKAPGIAVSVSALAHRNVQSYPTEKDCYRAMYNSCNDGEIMSMVADCYNYKRAVRDYLIPLALESQQKRSNKIVVGRPDSGDAKAQIIFSCELAVEKSLYEQKLIDGKYWKFPTTFKLIEGDGMTWAKMKEIIEALLERGFPPFAWFPFGVGGGLRNNLKRDNSSAKYALCAIGKDLQPVIKLSEIQGKRTLPGPFKLRRDKKSLRDGKTIAFYNEEGEDCLVEYFNGLRKEKPFGLGQDDNFLTIKKRIKEQLKVMPFKLESENFPASLSVIITQNKISTSV
jgi:nicotinamide phosphoribosyltransferase